MAKRVERTRNAGTLTEAEFFGKIRSALRNGFKYWKPMQIALDKASRKSQNANKKVKKEYQCCSCKKWYIRKDVQIDHIIECGSLRSFEDIPNFMRNLTQESADSYQILCKPCHLVKTKETKTAKKNETK